MLMPTTTAQSSPDSTHYIFQTPYKTNGPWLRVQSTGPGSAVLVITNTLPLPTPKGKALYRVGLNLNGPDVRRQAKELLKELTEMINKLPATVDLVGEKPDFNKTKKKPKSRRNQRTLSRSLRR